MRTLKFRAWDKKENKWLFGYEYPNLGGFSLTGEVVLLGELGSIPLEKWKDIEIMQFTGLKDKNGKEIYEGDILEHKRINNEVIWDNSKAKFIVRYKNIWKAIAHKPYYCYKTLEWAKDNGVVIGNVYENPDLISPERTEKLK